MKSTKFFLLCFVVVCAFPLIGCNKSADTGNVDAPLMTNAPPKPASLKGTPALSPMGSGGAGKAAGDSTATSAP